MRLMRLLRPTRWIAIASFFPLCAPFFPATPSWGAQMKSAEPAAEVLTLDKALKRAVAANRSIQLQRITLQLAEIAYKNAWDTMFMPGASLTLSSTQNYSVAQVPGGPGTSGFDHGYPAASAGLTFGTYTLFNFWKDWLVYEQANLDWVRAQEIFAEFLRSTRFQVMTAFFRLKAEQEKLEASKRSVGIAEAIRDLVKSKVRLGKASSSDISSSIVDYNNSKNDSYTHEVAERSALWALNQLLGDPVDTPYVILDPLRFSPLQITVPQAVKIYSDLSPTVKNSRRDMKKAEIAVDLAQKNRLPLPKVTFSGVTVSYAPAYYSTTASTYGPAQGNPNMDIVASMSLTLPLYGPGGFLNQRVVDQAQLARDQSDLNAQNSTNADLATLYQLMITIKRDEDTIKNNRQNLENSSAVLDNLFSKLSEGTVSRLELRDAIAAARDSDLALLDSNVTHLSDKFALAQLIGVDRLPGDLY
jgi:outer membrane protein TolC